MNVSFVVANPFVVLNPPDFGTITYGEVGGVFHSEPTMIETMGFCPDGIPCGVFTEVVNGAEITGLQPISVYQVTAAATIVEPGFTIAVTNSTTFATGGTFAFDSEHDLPYDSVTQEGGGANLQWSDYPIQKESNVGAVSFLNGSLSYTTSSGGGRVTTLPLTHVDSVPNVPGEHQVNLTVGLNLSDAVAVSAILNYTDGTNNFTLTSSLFSFVYLKDTSGDGLTDAEKVQGWGVTYTDVNGLAHNEQVTAINTSFATNGLVNDLLEKRFGLNPRTLDTAGSHMLDTWNLTFDVGNATFASLPHGFRVWYENSSFLPFNACPFPNAPVCSFAPATGSTEGGNLSDDAPWAAEQLWSSGALQTLQTLVFNEVHPGWLRGVSGHYRGELTLTVWGKLSWGANPLAASTPSDGLADGARVNPLHEVDLQATFLRSPSFGGGGFGISSQTGLSDGMGLAMRMWVNRTSPTGANLGQLLPGGGNSSAAFACPNSPCSASPQNGVTGYVLSLPVPQTIQTEHFDTQMLLNTATCTPPSMNINNNSNACSSDAAAYQLEQLPIGNGVQDSCATTISASVDMVDPPVAFPGGLSAYVSTGNTGCPNAPQATGSVALGLTAVAAGEKARTLLWVPSDNSTLSSLPQGLQRYTGEQDFFVVVASVARDDGFTITNQLTAGPIPDPWGTPGFRSGYNLTFGQGPVQFLIPRGQFLASPFGQAVMGDSVAQGSSLFAPLLGGSQAGLVLNGGNAATLLDDQCLWQNLATAPGQFTFTNGDLANACKNAGFQRVGNAPGSFYAVKVLADTENCTLHPSDPNCAGGGVPSNPALETSAPAPAIQSVITLNLSMDVRSAGGQDSPAWLEAFLAALLDNATGLVNGTFQDITSTLPTLGFSSAVLSALMNEPIASGGLFGAPISLAQPPPPPPPSCSNFLSCAWDTVSGVVQFVVNSVVHLAGLIWNAAIAVAAFFSTLGELTGLSALVEAAVAAATAVLKAVASAMEQALEALLAFVKQAVIELLSPVVAPLLAAVRSYDQSISVALNTTLSSMGNGNAFGQSDGESIVGALDGSVFLVGLGMGTAAAVAMTILTPVDVGSTFLVGIVISLVVSVVLQLAATGGLVGAFKGLQTLGSAFVYALEQAVNETAHAGSLLPLLSFEKSVDAETASATNASSLSWKLIVDLILFVVGGAFAEPFALGIDSALAGPHFGVGISLGFSVALGLVALALHGLHMAGVGGVALAVLALVLSGLGTFLSGRAIATESALLSTRGLIPLAYFVFFFNLAGLGWGLYNAADEGA